MKCPKCHFENPDDTLYCGKCATPLQEEVSISLTKTLETPVKDLIKGSIFADKYQVIEELGRGGMGVVYKAEDIKLKRTIALKFLSPELTRDSEARERFIQEAQAASALDHPNICTIHEIDETEDEQLYIAMAYYAGETLNKKIDHGPLDPKEALDIALQISQGLSKAHGKGIVHRDIKPANVIITNDGIAKIVDFGLAKLQGAARITKSKTTMGTIFYMSPEQARGEAVDQATDVWSLGVILYEMMVGQLPFRGENEQSVVYSILNKEPEPVKDLPSGIPLELEQIIRKALSKDPAKRFSSGKELAAALEELEPKLISGAYPSLKQMIFRRPRRRILIGGVVGLLVLATALITWVLTRPSLAFQERDRLLVADVDNQTEDSVFDLALRTAIEADLQQSPYASIFDKGQVAETLRLMRKEPNTRIDEELGCDICRFSGVRALVLPRIFSAGEAYELQAILIDPIKRRHVDRIRVTAHGREEVLLHSIDKLAHQIRSRLGESLASIEEADKPVIRVTTSSWEALQHLSIGMAKWQEAKFKESASFFELALDKDPKFVAARGSLGLLLIQFLNQKEKGKEMLQQALMDAEEQDLPQREFLKLKAINREFVDGDLKGALDEYHILTELYPDFWSAFNNSGMILRKLGRYEEAVTMFEKAAGLASRNRIPLHNLWWTNLNFRKDPSAAEEAGKKLVSLAPESAQTYHCLGYALSAQARFEEALEAYKKVLSLEPQHPLGLPNMAYILLAAGRATEAVPYFKEVRELVQKGRMQGYYPVSCFDLALALRESGEIEAAKEIAEEGMKGLIDKVGETWEAAWIPLLIAKIEIVSGKTDKADEYVSQAKSLGLNDQGAFIYLAEVYALSGKHQEAIDTIKQIIESGHSDPYFLQIYPAFQSIRNDPRFRALFGHKNE